MQTCAHEVPQPDSCPIYLWMLAIHLLQKKGDAYSRRKQDIGVETGREGYQWMFMHAR